MALGAKEVFVVGKGKGGAGGKESLVGAEVKTVCLERENPQERQQG